MKILITGATGLIGKPLVQKLLDNGYHVNILTRNIKDQPLHPNITLFEWKDYHNLPPQDAFLEISGVINLMGENIGNKRWSAKQKQIIEYSRINATRQLVIMLNKINRQIPLISASAIGYYPTNSPDVATEFSFKGEGFLSDLCFRWEQEALNSQDRVAIIRTGVVLSQKGGALKKMLLPFYLGLGGVIGNGSQYMSWIHLDDIVNLYFEALINSQYTGVINATTSNPISNFTFTKALGKSINRPTIFPIPTIIIKTLFGEMGSIILDSQKVISDRLEDLGFKFKYPKIEDALNHIIKEKT